MASVNPGPHSEVGLHRPLFHLMLVRVKGRSPKDLDSPLDPGDGSKEMYLSRSCLSKSTWARQERADRRAVQD